MNNEQVKLEKELKDLQEAKNKGLISTNEYSTMYYNTYQKIKALKIG